MINDLHWYMLPRFRKKGYLSKSLKSTILPYLFYEREEQEISIDIKKIGERNYYSSKRVAELLGFKKIETGQQKEFFIFFATFISSVNLFFTIYFKSIPILNLNFFYLICKHPDRVCCRFTIILNYAFFFRHTVE